MKSAVSYARVSSEEQRKGFSLESQVRTERNYAASNGFDIVKEFTISESAKKQGRKHFNAMLDYLREHPDVRVVLVEKMDRLCRNLPDFVAVERLVEELGLEIHLIKDGQVLRREAKSQDRLVQGMFALLARNYIQNQQEEIQKGQTIKAEKGQYPGRAPFGYAHDRERRTIVTHPTRAGVVTLLFELHSTGRYTIDTLRKAIIEKTGEKISKSYLHKVLTSQFYLGEFTWRGREYQGIHPRLVDSTTFERVQDIVSGRSKPKPRRHEFAFAGLMNCAEDDCAITAEQHKGKYTYYRCTFGRGRHKFPYLPEQVVADMLGMLLKQIEVPERVARAIADSTRHDTAAGEAKRREEISKLNQRHSALETRMRKAYIDKLDGVIDDEFWQIHATDWKLQKQQVEAALVQQSQIVPDAHGLSAERVLELADRAHVLYGQRSNVERAQLLKGFIFKCHTEGASVYPTYREPFALIFDASNSE